MTPEDTERIEILTARCEAITDPALRSDVLDLLRLILQFHQEALSAMLQAIAGAPHLEALLAAWRRDSSISALWELHELNLPEAAPAIKSAQYGDLYVLNQSAAR